MRNLTLQLLVVAVLVAACSSPADDSKPRPDAGQADLGSSLDMGDDGSDVGMNDPSDMPAGEFDFGFDAQPIDIVLNGLQPATVVWDGVERAGQFFLFDYGRIGTLSFDADGRTYTYRFQGEFRFSGEVLLGLTERSCSENGAACAEDVPDVLRENMVYDAIGRFDGEQIVFAPLTVRADAKNLAPDFDFMPPLDPRMTPNDGFKPAQVPDPVGTWVGRLTFIPNGHVLSGSDICTIVIDQVGADFLLESMACGDTTYVLNADPGPDTSTIEVDTTEFHTSFDFVDGTNRHTIAGVVDDQGIWAGVIVEASRYDELGSPLDADVGDVEGLFYLDYQP